MGRLEGSNIRAFCSLNRCEKYRGCSDLSSVNGILSSVILCTFTEDTEDDRG